MAKPFHPLVTKTERGFDLITFEDRYANPCNIQKSSLATEEAIWFGFSGPDGDRMHLTQHQVARLLPILQKFVDTGELV